MLRKLMKYEFLATGRIFLPLFGALLITAAVNRLIAALNLGIIPEGIVGILLIMLTVAVFIIIIMQTIRRFWENLLSSEGHLSMTLPVSTNSLILSKLFTASIWSFSSFIVALLSFMIIAPYEFDAQFFRELSALFAGAPPQMALFAGELIVFIVLAIFANILALYTCMSLSQLVSNRRVLFAFGMYVAINTVLQIIVAIVIAAGAALEMSYGWLTSLSGGLSGVEQGTMILLPVIIFELIICVAFYLVTHCMLKNKLNIQ